MTEPTLATAFLAYVAKIQEQRERIAELEVGIESIRNIIGPTPCACEGQQVEVAYALRVIAELLNPPTN